jgi:hypothetical protein
MISDPREEIDLHLKKLAEHSQIIKTDPLEDFRNNFYKNLEDEKIKKEKTLKLKQKYCFHKYSRFIPYNENFTLASCERCNHAKFVKN